MTVSRPPFRNPEPGDRPTEADYNKLGLHRQPDEMNTGETYFQESAATSAFERFRIDQQYWATVEWEMLESDRVRKKHDAMLMRWTWAALIIAALVFAYLTDSFL